MKAKLLHDAGDIVKGAAVEIKSMAGFNTLDRTWTSGDRDDARRSTR